MQNFTLISCHKTTIKYSFRGMFLCPLPSWMADYSLEYGDNSLDLGGVETFGPG
jgi:hypothetical protein